MANYNLVIDSQFQPFSYQELLAPVLMTTQAHQDLENKYSEIADKASVWERLKGQEQDRDVYEQYKNYADSLEQMSNDLAMRGLNNASRQNFFNMKNRYAKEIIPIENAYNKRAAQVALQQQAKLQDNTMMFSRDASQVGLREFMNNPELTFANYSGKQLAAEVSAGAKALSTELRDAGEKGKAARLQLQKILPFQYRTLEQHGFRPDEVLAAIQKSDDAPKILTDLVQNAIGASGIRNWNNAEALKQAEYYGNLGLYDAVGQSKWQYLKDDYGADIAKLRYQHELANADKKDPGVALAALNPMNIYSPEEAKEREQMLKDFDRYKQYFYVDRNGKVQMNEAGKKAYNENYRQPVGSYGSTLEPVSMRAGNRISDFRVFMDKLQKKASRGDSFGKMWTDFSKAAKEVRDTRYDARKFTEFSYDVEEGSKAMKKVLNALDNGNELWEAEFNSNSKTFKRTDKSASAKNLEDAEVLSSRYSAYGNTVMVKLKDGTVKRYMLPANVHPRAIDNMSSTLRSATELQQAIYGNKYPVYDSNGNFIRYKNLDTNSDNYNDIMSEMRQRYADLLQQATWYQSQIWSRNKTKPQEWETTGF